MLGSIYIGLSGLAAYSRGLQTISSNVANLNAPGFKATSFSFGDTFSYGGPGSGRSANPLGQQFGGGVRYGAERMDLRQGDLRQSGGDLDLAIQGEGFLVLLDQGRTYYARTGQFRVDAEGYVADTASGHRLAMLDAQGRAVPIHVDATRSSPPSATTRIRFSDNLSSSATQANVSDIAVHDSQGTRHVWQVRFEPAAGLAGEWSVKVTDQTGATVGQTSLRFIAGIVDPATARLNISSNPAGAEPLSVELDFSSGVTSFSSGTLSTIRAAQVDGHGFGNLTRVAIDEDGQVKLTYSNQQTRLLGPVALAAFQDAQRLERIGGGLLADRGDGGVALSSSRGDGVGRLVSGQMEASNVDLSQQFGDLILVQRGFQASSQVISISNDMIQQLFGIRGQG